MCRSVGLTDIIAPGRGRRRAVRATADAIAQGQIVVILAEHSASAFLYRLDGRLGRFGGYDMYWRLQLVRTLGHPISNETAAHGRETVLRLPIV